MIRSLLGALLVIGPLFHREGPPGREVDQSEDQGILLLPYNYLCFLPTIILKIFISVNKLSKLIRILTINRIRGPLAAFSSFDYNGSL
jgi:hypothetical protein